jgi:hypothetical protein
MHYILYNEDLQFNPFYQWIRHQTPNIGIVAHTLDINTIVHYNGFVELIHVYCSPGSNSLYLTQEFLRKNMEYILNNRVRIIFHNSAASDLIDYLITRNKFEKKYLRLPKVFKIDRLGSFYYSATFMVSLIGQHNTHNILFTNNMLAYYQKSSYYSFVFFDVVGTTVKDMPLSLAFIMSLIRDDEPEIGSKFNDTGDELSPV